MKSVSEFAPDLAGRAYDAPSDQSSLGAPYTISNAMVFTALRGMQTRSSDDHSSVRPTPVRLSNAWIVTKNGRTICPDFHTIQKII